jgi:hypothetical protein
MLVARGIRPSVREIAQHMMNNDSSEDWPVR